MAETLVSPSEVSRDLTKFEVADIQDINSKLGDPDADREYYAFFKMEGNRFGRFTVELDNGNNFAIIPSDKSFTPIKNLVYVVSLIARVDGGNRDKKYKGLWASKSVRVVGYVGESTINPDALIADMLAQQEKILEKKRNAK